MEMTHRNPLGELWYERDRNKLSHEPAVGRIGRKVPADPSGPTGRPACAIAGCFLVASCCAKPEETADNASKNEQQLHVCILLAEDLLLC